MSGEVRGFRRRPLPWRVWDAADTSEPLAEGTEEAMRHAAEGFHNAGVDVILSDPDGPDYSYGEED